MADIRPAHGWGRRRAVGMPDLLTAVLATVVAFEQVWVMPRGSL
jgi:hypothetical protein